MAHNVLNHRLLNLGQLPATMVRGFDAISHRSSLLLALKYRHGLSKYAVRSVHASTALGAKKGKAPRPRSEPVQYETPMAVTYRTFEKEPKKINFPFKWALVGTILVGVVTYSFLRIRKVERDYEEPRYSVPQDPSARYRETAESFDKDIAWTETLTGINRKRRRLMRRASGHVLEVSAGTGRNLEYYDLSKCKSITLLDQAPQMTKVSHEKYEKLKSDGKLRYNHARFVTQSALDEGIDTPPGGFDTVVQTFGLCSTGDPVGLLKQMGKLVKQDTGKILLLEHGRGMLDFLNRLLDKSAAAHAAQHGCWWNRDIAEIVKQSGLEIVSERKYILSLGTTYWYELRPAKMLEP